MVRNGRCHTASEQDQDGTGSILILLLTTCAVIFNSDTSVLITIPNQMHYFIKFIFGIKLYMFRTVPLSIIRSFSLYTHNGIRHTGS